MFAKLSTLALTLPLVSALTINIPTEPTAGSTVTITWTATTTDPAYFTIELVNPAFNNDLAIANNVQTSLGSITITLPQVAAGDGYSLEAIAVNNIGDVYSQTSDFSIGAASTTSGAAASTTSTPATTGTTSSGTVSAPSVTATTPVSSVATTGTASAASSTPSTSSSSGAAAFKVAGIAPAAALVLSAVAGAAMVF